jgi:hypothetical protein
LLAKTGAKAASAYLYTGRWIHRNLRFLRREQLQLFRSEFLRLFARAAPDGGGIGSESPSWPPTIHPIAPALHDAAALVYDTLFSWNAEMAARPQMVERWTISDDKLLYTFTSVPG